MEAAIIAKAVLGVLALVLVHGTLLALVALVATRRMRPALQAGVWLVVLAKFALPWGPSLPFSLADVIERLRGGPGSTAPALAVGPAAGGPEVAASTSTGWLVLAIVWLSGTLVVVGRAALAYRRARAAAFAATPAPSAAHVLLVELAARVRVRAPRLVVGDGGVGPHVVGLFRPVVVVPPSLLDDHVVLRAALLHELAHIRRRDALARIVQLWAVALFWFWPVVRLSSRRLERAREAACDAWALEAGEISRPAYARLLLQMSQLRRGAMPLAAPAGLDERVMGVLGPQLRPRLDLPHWLGLVVWVAIALGGARSSTAAAPGNTCVYTTELAESLRVAHPEADVDGDGVLSHEEACDLQAEMARRAASSPTVSARDETTSSLLAEPLCCNCDAAERAFTASPGASCLPEGVDR